MPEAIAGISIDADDIVIISEHQLQKPGDAHLRVVLAWTGEEYATWTKNLSFGGSYCHGHYFHPRSFEGRPKPLAVAYKAALRDYLKRVAKEEGVRLEEED